MTKTIKANQKQIAIAKNTIEAFDNATSSIDTAIAAGLEMGKVLAAITKRATVDGKLSLSLLDSGLVSLGLREPKIEGDKRSNEERDIGLSKNDRSLCKKLFENQKTVKANVKKAKKSGSRIKSVSGALAKSNVIRNNTPIEPLPQNEIDEKFVKLLNKFYADCRKLGIDSITALEKANNTDSEEAVNADLKMAS